MQSIASVRPLSESREWKVLKQQIDEAMKDPEFVRFLRGFSKQHCR